MITKFCVFETLEERNLLAKLLREKSNLIQLLLSHIKPHFSVGACTMFAIIHKIFESNSSFHVK